MKNVKNKTTAVKKPVAAKKRASTRTVAGAQNNGGMRVAISDFFARYCAFNGVSTRAQYWWVALFVCVVLGVCLLVVPFFAVLFNFGIFAWFVYIAFWLAMLFGVAIVIPSLALISRRIHDAGFSAWVLFLPWAIVVLLQFVLPHSISGFLHSLISIWGFVLALLPSKTADNPYRD